MGPNANTLANRLEGRLFSAEGHLHFVLNVDMESGLARVSCRINDKQRIVQLPISEVSMRLSSASNSSFDNVSTADTSNRIIQQTDGWFFNTREGLQGPFRSDGDAKSALVKHLLAAQRPSVS